jgi:transcriptional repressor NrdR
MRCPFCEHSQDRVVDSRVSARGDRIRRRRECSACERRYTTYERIEEPFPDVVKADETREEYDREKLRRGIALACTKRPIGSAEIDDVVDDVESALLDSGDTEVSSEFIGSLVTEALRDLDPVAYIRYASVYRGFSEIQEFLAEIQELDDAEQPGSAQSSSDAR